MLSLPGVRQVEVSSTLRLFGYSNDEYSEVHRFLARASLGLLLPKAVLIFLVPAINFVVLPLRFQIYMTSPAFIRAGSVTDFILT